mmetsp:Transcript_7237/g.45214  ORF Transcript_7237/g.45214 Transcript_7237/m.45214 type:complete len:208 (+) Transcript_7237:111-734(+)
MPLRTWTRRTYERREDRSSRVQPRRKGTCTSKACSRRTTISWDAWTTWRWRGQGSKRRGGSTIVSAGEVDPIRRVNEPRKRPRETDRTTIQAQTRGCTKTGRAHGPHQGRKKPWNGTEKMPQCENKPRKKKKKKKSFPTKKAKRVENPTKRMKNPCSTNSRSARWKRVVPKGRKKTSKECDDVRTTAQGTNQERLDPNQPRKKGGRK